MGEACSAHGRDEKLMQHFWLKSPKERPHGNPMYRLDDNIKRILGK
jgi:hypothetical protein